MKRRVLLVALAFASAGAFATHVVPVLTAEQKAFLALSAAERRAVFTNAAYRTKLADSVRKMNWREPADGETSRWRRLPGIPNMRDLGGLKGLDGRTVACGRIFRSGAFNDNAKSELVDDADHPGEKKRVWKERGKDRLTDDARKFQIENFGIRTDLDLRTDGECNEMTASPLGPQVTWVHSPSQSYGSFFSNVGKASTKRNFALFLDERNYPIAVHCIAGADRTGSLIYLLEALLGVSDDDLLLDWELTAFYSSTVNFAHAPRYDKLVAGFARLPGRTTCEQAESYVRSIGFTDEDIVRFRKIMLCP